MVLIYWGKKLRFSNPHQFSGFLGSIAFSFFVQYELTFIQSSRIWGYKAKSSPPAAPDLGQTKAARRRKGSKEVSSGSLSDKISPLTLCVQFQFHEPLADTKI